MTAWKEKVKGAGFDLGCDPGPTRPIQEVTAPAPTREYNTPGLQTNLTYMALACFSARSPITGSLYITPWLAFISRMIHTMRKPTQRPAQIRNEIKCPKIGMNAKTMDTMNRPIQSTTAARCKNRFCHEWKRTNRLLLYGTVTRKMIAGMIVL